MKKNIQIIGGGCAGLSLAKYLNQLKDYEIKVYENKNNKIINDHYWGFWKINSMNEAFKISEKKWHRWKIISYEEENFFNSEKYPYCALTRKNWLNYCKKLSNVKIINKKVIKKDNKFFLGDKKLKGNFIFDSRQPDLNENVMLQHFHGTIIECKEKVFDSNVATLMDFRCNQSKGIHFIYLLPFSRTKALVESTLFSKKIEKEDFYFNEIKIYLKNIYKISKFRITHIEKGIIPMSYICLPNKNCINIGTRGGATKPSSGYTFYFIQKQVQNIVNQIQSKTKVSNFVHNKFDLLMDKIFIDVLEKNTNSAPKIFLKLTSNLTGDEMALFMTGYFKLSIWKKIILKLPKLIFIKSLFRVLVHG